MEADPVDFNWVNVRWGPSTDDAAVKAYRLYRNGVALANRASSRRWYSDTTVAPGTTYLYEVDAVDVQGNRSARSSAIVTTPPLPPYPTIAAAGDIACDPSEKGFNGGNGTSSRCRQRYTARSLVRAQFTAVLPLGDTQYTSGVYENYLRSYDKSWGRVKGSTRPVPGNHEYFTSGAAGYFRYFGSLAGARSKGYYSYTLGSWRVVALNSSVPHGSGSAQLAWLKNVLAANTSICTLAYWHEPRWSSGRHGSNTSVAPLWKAVHAGGAEVVLNGSDHSYERFAPQDGSGRADPATGVRAFVVGTGGRELYGFSTVKANSQVRHGKTYGVLMLKLEPTSYSWRFVPEAGKAFTDSGTTACH